MSLALTALLVFCLIAWGFVLVPPVLRLLSGMVRPSDSIGSFRAKMTLLGGSSPVEFSRLASPPKPLASPAMLSRSEDVSDLRAHRAARINPSEVTLQRRAAKQRRRNIFHGLLGAAGFMFLVGVLVGGAAWVLFGLTLVAFAGYTALLLQMQQAARERARKVSFLPNAQRQEPVSANLRRISVGR